MPRYRNEDNILMMFNRFLKMCETQEQKTLVLDMKQAFLEIKPEDVVPRSEVEELQKKLVVQKRCNNELVKICEKLNKDLAEFENKQFSCDSCDRIALTSAEHKHCIEQAKQEVARKIFEEIEKYLQPNEDWAFEMNRQNQDCSEEYWGGKLSAFKQIRGFIDVNLKKKYIGE